MIRHHRRCRLESTGRHGCAEMAVITATSAQPQALDHDLVIKIEIRNRHLRVSHASMVNPVAFDVPPGRATLPVEPDDRF